MPEAASAKTRVRLPELLAPAGSPGALRSALAGGADAIYCGLSELNARRGAENFTDESFAEACRIAHLAGTRVYLTENIAIKDAELEGAVRLAERAAALGADALIVCDLGLLAELRERDPEIEIHVSTQANVGDVAGLLRCAEYGASRVTLSRELSLEEIAEIAAAGVAAGVECEVFCHGALCMAYSGICRMSAARGTRSANRGLCAQPCRLPHRLRDASGRPLAGEGSRGLCPKDLCALGELADLVDAGVAALKIEGRMKAPDYVLAVTRAWRGALDAVRTSGEGRARVPAEALDAARADLTRAFNRSFTSAYLHGRSGNEMMSYERSNNRGALVGSVAESSGNAVVVALGEGVGEGDLLEFRPEEAPDRFLAEPAPREAHSGERLEMTLKRPMAPGTPVRALRREATIREARALAKSSVPRPRPVDLAARVVIGEPLRLRLITPARTPEERAAHGGEVAVEVVGAVVEPARSKPLELADVERHLTRFGGSPFTPRSIEVELSEGAGLAFSALHHLRADAAAALEEALLEGVPKVVAAKPAAAKPAAARPELARPRAPLPAEGEVCCLAPSLEVARAAREAGAARVYIETALCPGEEVVAALAEGCIPWLSEVSREATVAREAALLAPGRPCAVSTLSGLERAALARAVAEVGWDIPVMNARAIWALAASGARGLWLSYELSSAEIAALAKASPIPLGLKVAGALRVMTTEHCVLAAAGPCDGVCERCARTSGPPTLENIDGHRLPVVRGADGRTRVFWDEPLELVSRVGEIVASGVSRLLVDASLMGAERAASEVRRLRASLEAPGRAAGARPRSRTTRGHFPEPVA